MSRVFQRSGRAGYYLGVSVPRKLRSQYNKCEVIRKLGNTRREADANKHRVEALIQREFGGKEVSLVEKLEADYNSPNSPHSGKELPLHQLPEEDKEAISAAYDSAHVDPKTGKPLAPQVEAVWLALEGKSTWQQWINRRKVLETPRPATITNWSSKLRSLARWYGSEYLADLTKEQAIAYRDYQIQQGFTTNTILNNIGGLSGFWNWGIEEDIVDKNIWAGLKKRLPKQEVKDLPPTDEQIASATLKASTTDSRRKEKDYAFLIQRYTGCRKGEANGLRHCDIDLVNKTIRFEEWQKTIRFKKERGGMKTMLMTRSLKTGLSAERTLPMTDALYESIKDIELKKDSDDPLWPRRYKEVNASWGDHWVSEYKVKYGFTSHKLRTHAITKLNLAGVNGYIIYEIVRHQQEGVSSITMKYTDTRGRMEELREIKNKAFE